MNASQIAGRLEFWADETDCTDKGLVGDAAEALTDLMSALNDARLIAISSESHDMGHALAEAWGVDMTDADGPDGVHEKAGEAKRRWVLRQGKERASTNEGSSL